MEKKSCHWCQLRSFPTYQSAPVTIINDKDGEVLPQNFQFIDNVVLGNDVQAADSSFRSGCTCTHTEGCQYAGCLCLADIDEIGSHDENNDVHGIVGTTLTRRKIYAYHTHGRKAGLLRSNLHASKVPIYECHQGCCCTVNCPNRVVERGRTVPLQIFRTEDRGWGKMWTLMRQSDES